MRPHNNACWIGDHLGSHDTQTTSLRAFRAAEQYAFGKRGRPRFKSLNRLNSIEGKADAVIRYLTATLIISAAPLRSCGKPVRGLTCTRSTSPWPRVEVHFGLCGRHLVYWGKCCVGCSSIPRSDLS